MKIYLEGHDRGGFEDVSVVIGKNKVLLREPAVILLWTGRVCFSFLWDGVRRKNQGGRRGDLHQRAIQYDLSGSSLKRMR
jgi:hypothetical protein